MTTVVTLTGQSARAPREVAGGAPGADREAPFLGGRTTNRVNNERRPTGLDPHSCSPVPAFPQVDQRRLTFRILRFPPPPPSPRFAL